MFIIQKFNLDSFYSLVNLGLPINWDFSKHFLNDSYLRIKKQGKIIKIRKSIKETSLNLCKKLPLYKAVQQNTSQNSTKI